MQKIDPYEFEEFVAALWRRQGWDASTTQGSQDMGVDVVAERKGAVSQRHVIQAKRYGEGNKVGRPTLQQSYSLKDQDRDADAVIVVTTSEFTSQARVWAMDHNVKLIDGEELANIVVENNAHDLVDRYAPTPDAEPEPDTNESSTFKEEFRAGAGMDADTSSESEAKPAAKPTGPPPDEPAIPGAFGHLVAAVLLQALAWTLLLDPTLVPLLGQTLPAVVAMFSMFVVPFLTFKDGNALHAAGTSYTPNRIIWPTACLFLPVIAPLAYLYQRGTETNIDFE